MSKLLKIGILFILLFCMNNCISNAETTNLYNDVENEQTSNSSSNTTSDNSTSTNETDDNSTEENDDDIDLFDHTETSNRTSSPTPPASTTARVNTVSSVSEANLGLNNVLCIILIALGVLMILLAIAILIRLKK